MDDIAEKIESLLADEESMRQIRELAAMFSAGNGGFSEDGGTASDGGTGSEDAGFPDFSDFPDINFAAVMQLIGAMSRSDKNCDLLIALKPHLCTERQLKLDRAVKLLKLYNAFAAMRESGMLNDLERLL